MAKATRNEQALGRQAAKLDALIDELEAEVRSGTEALEQARAARKAITVNPVKAPARRGSGSRTRSAGSGGGSAGA